MLSDNVLNFDPFSIVGALQCVTFAPVQDDIAEEDEVMTFQIEAVDNMDLFDGNGVVSITITDDDGMYVCMLCVISRASCSHKLELWWGGKDQRKSELLTILYSHRCCIFNQRNFEYL